MYQVVWTIAELHCIEQICTNNLPANFDTGNKQTILIPMLHKHETVVNIAWMLCKWIKSSKNTTNVLRQYSVNYMPSTLLARFHSNDTCTEITSLIVQTAWMFEGVQMPLSTLKAGTHTWIFYSIHIAKVSHTWIEGDSKLAAARAIWRCTCIHMKCTYWKQNETCTKYINFIDSPNSRECFEGVHMPLNTLKASTMYLLVTLPMFQTHELAAASTIQKCTYYIWSRGGSRNSVKRGRVYKIKGGRMHPSPHFFLFISFV